MGHGLAGSDPGIWFWWVGVGVLLVIELMSGTFYLLLIALGFLLAGLSRLLGASGGMQVLIAGVLALAAVVGVRFGKRAWRQRAQRRSASGRDDLPLSPIVANSAAQPDSAGNLDIGMSVWVDQWVNGRARVAYRGTHWDAVLEGTAVNAVPMPAPGWYYIDRIDGIRLILRP